MFLLLIELLWFVAFFSVISQRNRTLFKFSNYWHVQNTTAEEFFYTENMNELLIIIACRLKLK